MKILRLTKRQYEELRGAFIQGAICHGDHLNDMAWDEDGNVISKESLKNYNAYKRIIKKLEVKLNCKVT